MRRLSEQPTGDKGVQKIDQRASEQRRLISGALLGFAGVCIVQMLGLSRLDSPLQFALSAFAVSVPFHAMEISDRQAEERFGITFNLSLQRELMAIAVLISLAGVTGIFWHFSVKIAVLFLTAIFGCLWAHSSYLTTLRKSGSATVEDKDAA